MTTGIPELHTALIYVLRNSPELQAISHGTDGKALVFSDKGVPDGLEPPYTVIRSLQGAGPYTTQSASSWSNLAQEVLVTIDTWSAFAGPDESELMHKAIFDTLNSQEAAITAQMINFRCTYSNHDGNDQQEDPDSIIRLFHGVERYRIRIEAL